MGETLHTHICTEVRVDFWGETPPSPPLLLPTHPPFLLRPLATAYRKTHLCDRQMLTHPFRNHLAASARKTRRPAFRSPTLLARTRCTIWSERCTAFVGGKVGWEGSHSPSGEGWGGPFLLRSCAAWCRRAHLRCLWQRGAGEGLPLQRATLFIAKTAFPFANLFGCGERGVSRGRRCGRQAEGRGRCGRPRR